MVRYGHIFAWLLAGIAASFVPLIGDFYLETAQFCAVSFSFYTILISGVHRQDQDVLLQVFLSFVAFLAPIFVRVLLAGCFSTDGLLFLLFIPLPAVLFTLVLTRLLFRLSVSFSKTLASFAILFLSTVPVLGTLRLNPHVFVFNSIWGWFPGPIYDEFAVFDWPLAYYRLNIILWTIIFSVLASYRDYKSKLRKLSFLLILVVLHMFSWTSAGIIHPLSHIESKLGGVAESENFRLIYEEGVVEAEEVSFWLFWHEFHYHDLKKRLNLDDPPHKITSVLYTDPWQKQRFTGAKYTSYVPVWNKTDQLHIDRSSGEQVLRHELVHVLAKSFSAPLLGASYNLALTEGLASAFDDPRFQRMTKNELIVNSGFDLTSESLRRIFTIWGFYSGRASVNYAVSGSFLRYMVDQELIDDIKSSYRNSRLSICDTETDEFISSWISHVYSTPVDSSFIPFARAVFSRESIFEKKCPRLASEFEEFMDNYRLKLTRKQHERAFELLDEYLKNEGYSESLWLLWSRQAISLGMADQIAASFGTVKTDSLNLTPSVLLRVTDALFQDGDFEATSDFLAEFDVILNEQLHSNNALMLRGIDSASVDTILYRNFINIAYFGSEIQFGEAMTFNETHLNLHISQNLSGYLPYRPEIIEALESMEHGRLSVSSLSILLGHLSFWIDSDYLEMSEGAELFDKLMLSAEERPLSPIQRDRHHFFQAMRAFLFE